jgi:elongation factor Ts
MSFTAKDVAQLRQMTGAGMMDCKKALTEVGGDLDEAVNFLRQKGMASAAKKAGNIAAEGLIRAAVSADKKTAAVVEVNSQTDFVAKNEDFIAFVEAVAQTAVDNKISNIETLLETQLNSKSIKDGATELTAKIGEKIDVRRVALVEATGIVAQYVHPVGSKVGVVVALSADDAQKASDMAMHIAASNPAPEYITKDEINPETIAREKEIESKKDDLAGKPAEMVEKIVEGRVNKLLAAKVLMEQGFIKDPNQKISAYLAGANVEAFTRLDLGEGIEKKNEDYASEVAAAMKV